MESHGGYLCRIEGFGAADVQKLAREALLRDGEDPDQAALQISTIQRRKVVRLAYDGPFTYGRRGAHWYAEHHALAQVMSAQLGATVHTYVFDPDELELVLGFGDGRRVGGEVLRYEDAESGELELTETAFQRLQQSWPMGHLAYVFGVAREELLRLPRARSILLPLAVGEGPREALENLWTPLASAGT